MAKLNSDTSKDFTIRVPLKMVQLTEQDGTTWPIAFYWPNVEGVISEVKIDNVKSIVTQAEQKSGTVGDRYECEIEGKIEYIYYLKLRRSPPLEIRTKSN